MLDVELACQNKKDKPFTISNGSITNVRLAVKIFILALEHANFNSWLGFVILLRTPKIGTGPG